MPISKKNRELYPANWKAIAERVKANAWWRCECTGECGHGHGVTLSIRAGRCTEVHGRAAATFRGKVVLTVGHVDHDPRNNANENLRAWCQRCHLAHDHEHHQANAAKTREERRARA